MYHMSDNSKTPTQQLAEILGFDPTREAGLTKDGISDVAAELMKERSDKAKAVAKDFLSKAIDVAQKKAKLEREFKKSSEAFDKELRKLVNRLNAAVAGRPPPEENEGEQKQEQ